jgi:hypothetical protein
LTTSYASGFTLGKELQYSLIWKVDRSRGEWKSTDIRKEGGKGQFQYFVLPASNLVMTVSVLSVSNAVGFNILWKLRVIVFQM